MPFPNPDAAVQAIVAELAALHTEDSAAILAVLNGHERTIIEQLLHTHIGSFETSLAASGAASRYDPSRLSPWLVQRLQTAKSEESDMTPQARKTLLDCVTKLYPVIP
ncbi:MAG TPA: hypothetical protein VJ750_02295 [Rhizomicrobium sp.]|nr:hypothetical protein [Rhizomicrobium sp.]